MRSTIITCAVTGAATTPEQTPYLPVTPEQIATSALEAAEAGAAVVHLHVRDPATGKPSMQIELYEDVVARIRQHNSLVLINLTTGPGAHYVPDPANMTQGTHRSLMLDAETRVHHVLKIKPELCSMDFNVMHHATDVVRINYKPVVKRMLELVQQAGTKPELEIFDSGDFRIAQEFVDDGTIHGTPFWQFAMGVKYGWPSSPQALTFAHSLLRPNSVWSAFGISKDEMPILAQTHILGGHVRVGLEDNIYTSKGILAKSNAELVSMGAEIIRLLGGQVANPRQARDMLGISK
jgi:uncharacterized protein (DUF849 family)